MTTARLNTDIGILNNIILDSQAVMGSRFNPNNAPTFLAARGINANSIRGSINTPALTLQDLLNGFSRQWAGWLAQQAIASPNNRDFRPTNATADLSTATAFSPLIGPRANGLTGNNFWITYNAQNGTLSLAFCTADPCVVRVNSAGTAVNATNAVAYPTGDVNRRNINLVQEVGSLQNIATLNVPFGQAGIFPGASNSALQDLASGANSGRPGYFNGNLIIDAGRIGDTGNLQRPAFITGTIKVNGDLVIRGQVRGEGRFIVRGNVYIVGDLVYNCAQSGGACRTNDGDKPSYRKPDGMPKLALLAGGSIIVGDYDHPDFRANRSQFNLINDQVGQARLPNAPSTAAANPGANPTWLYQTIPGQTGTNMTSASNGNMGFAPMTAANGNNRGGGNRYFLSAPFGLMLARGGFGSYESGGTQINSTTRSIITLSPSNGPIRTGDRNNSGFVSQPGAVGSPISNASLSCTTNGTAGINNPVSVIPTMYFNDTTNRAPLHVGFWCPPNTGQFFRTWSGSGSSPAQDTAAWAAQPNQNRLMDSSAGLTTGWLGGLLRVNQQTAAGTFDTLGDLSQTRLLKIMWASTMESTSDRNPDEDGVQSIAPLRTDGLLYSANSLFSVARFYSDQRTTASTGPRSNAQGRWIHNGSLLSFELGFLLTGNPERSADTYTVNRQTKVDFSPSQSNDLPSPWNRGPAMGVFWDERLSGLLGLEGGRMAISRTGIFTQVGR
jgi:hypothetical protein